MEKLIAEYKDYERKLSSGMYYSSMRELFRCKMRQIEREFQERFNKSIKDFL